MFKDFAELLSYVKQNRKGTAIIAGPKLNAIKSRCYGKKEDLCKKYPGWR